MKRLAIKIKTKPEKDIVLYLDCFPPGGNTWCLKFYLENTSSSDSFKWRLKEVINS